MTLKPILEKLYPEGSKQGQCGVFAEKVVAIGLIGDSLAAKTRAVSSVGIMAGSLNQLFKLGDVLILNVHTFNGHVAVVNTIDSKNKLLTVSESNYRGDQRVHHTRQIAFNDPMIVGVLRNKFLFNTPVLFPIVPNILLVQNGPAWTSMGAKFAEIRQRLLTASNNQMDINIDVAYVNFPNVPFTTNGYPSRKGVDLNWYAQNIAPLKKTYDAICFLTDRVDPALAWGWHSIGLEMQLFCNEVETIYSSLFGTMNVFVQIFLHELGHDLKELDGLPDVTHQYLDNQKLPVGIFDYAGLLNTCNYQNIYNNLLN